jgi:hypothetical protein
MPATISRIASTIWVLAAVSNSWGQDAAVDPAVIAAQTRQDLVKTLEIQFKRTEVISKGAITTFAVAPGKPLTLKPDKETTLESTNLVVIDGTKIRVEDNHPLPPGAGGEITTRSEVKTFDGLTGAVFLPAGVDGKGYPVAAMSKNDETGLGSPILIPIGLTFRGLSPLLHSFSINKVKPTEATFAIDGAQCQEYAVTESGAGKASLWLDPSKGYVLRRMQSRNRVGVVDQLEVSYRRHDSFGWVPSSWVHSKRHPDGRTLISTKVEVLTLRLNDPQPAAQFDIRFPPETFVNDFREGERNAKYFRVQPDGSMREVSSTGQELASCGSEPDASSNQRSPWLLLGIGVVVAAILLQKVARRKRTSIGLNNQSSQGTD